jgi:thioredoxin reductase
MKRLIILGAGPRGLAVALQAKLFTDLEVMIIDEEPLSTWSDDYMVKNIQMRSPTSFDLVTFQPDLQEYSLNNFLGLPSCANNQEAVENYPTFCNRGVFINYLNHIKDILLNLGVVFKYQQINKIYDSYLQSVNKIYHYDYLVLALGRKAQKYYKPLFFNKEKELNVKDIQNKSFRKTNINVLGSGQHAAEIANYLCTRNANVTWIQKTAPKINQYPIPCYKEWGYRSALGNYYTTLIYQQDKLDYLKKVKQWTPSITPDINKQLNNHLKSNKLNIILDPKTTEQININDLTVYALGFLADIRLVNFQFDLNIDKYNYCLPDIKTDFKSTSHPNIYFTGSLATKHNGPCQGSIISAANTAATIVNSILN